MYIEVITTNLSFERKLHFPLTSPYVIVVGDNGTGKTAVMNAVRVACTGAAQDLGGKDPRKEVRAGVRDLVASARTSAEASVRFSNGGEYHWTHAFAKRPTTQLAGHAPEVVLPFDDALDAFRGNNDTRLKYFCQRFMRESQLLDFDWSLATEVYDLISASLPASDTLCVVDWLLKFWGRQAAAERVATKRIGTLGEIERFLDENFDNSTDAHVAHALDTLLVHQLSRDRTKCPCCSAESTAEVLRARLDKVTAIIKDKVLASPMPVGTRALLERERDAVMQSRAQARKHIAAVRALLQYELRQHAAAIEAAVNAKLQSCTPPRKREKVELIFGFNIDDKGDITMGRRTGEHIRVFPSAAETVLLLTALSLVVAERQEKLPILLIPDRAYDKDMFHHLCVLLGQSEVIAFVPSVVYALPPSDKWGRIDLNEHTGRGIPK